MEQAARKSRLTSVSHIVRYKSFASRDAKLFLQGSLRCLKRSDGRNLPERDPRSDSARRFRQCNVKLALEFYLKESRVYDTKSRPAFRIDTGNRIAAVLFGVAIFFTLVSPSIAGEDADAPNYVALIAGPFLAMLLVFFLWSR